MLICPHPHLLPLAADTAHPVSATLSDTGEIQVYMFEPESIFQEEETHFLVSCKWKHQKGSLFTFSRLRLLSIKVQM